MGITIAMSYVKHLKPYTAAATTFIIQVRVADFYLYVYQQGISSNIEFDIG